MKAPLVAGNTEGLRVFSLKHNISIQPSKLTELEHEVILIFYNLRLHRIEVAF